jgi:hypothetical protein
MCLKQYGKASGGAGHEEPSVWRAKIILATADGCAVRDHALRAAKLHASRRSFTSNHESSGSATGGRSGIVPATRLPKTLGLAAERAQGPPAGGGEHRCQAAAAADDCGWDRGGRDGEPTTVHESHFKRVEEGCAMNCLSSSPSDLDERIAAAFTEDVKLDYVVALIKRS